MAEAILRRFARDQWMRVHGTPRVTVLVGGDRGRLMWLQWLRAGGLEGTLVDSSLGTAVAQATSRAMAAPAMPIAICCSRAELAGWRTGRADRLAAMVDEGVVEIPDDEPGGGRARGAVDALVGKRLVDARSAAEAALLEALDATPATAGRFEAGGTLEVDGAAAAYDALARHERIAIAIEGAITGASTGAIDGALGGSARRDDVLARAGYHVLRVRAHEVMKDARPVVAAVALAIAAR